AAVLYELNPRAGWVAGIDVGRQWVRAAIADLNGNVVARRDERARVKSADALISQMADLAHALAAEAGIRWRQVTVATVGSPGVFQPSSGQVALDHNLPGWGRRGLVEALHERLRTEITFENDVNLATVGAQWRGLGKDVGNFVFLHVGTGVGMRVVLNGALYRGSGGHAGVVAYLRLARSGPLVPYSLRRGALGGAAVAIGVAAVART